VKGLLGCAGIETDLEQCPSIAAWSAWIARVHDRDDSFELRSAFRLTSRLCFSTQAKAGNEGDGPREPASFFNPWKGKQNSPEIHQSLEHSMHLRGLAGHYVGSGTITVTVVLVLAGVSRQQIVEVPNDDQRWLLIASQSSGHRSHSQLFSDILVLHRSTLTQVSIP
jgi:hypothetical protein